ncbi:hypothetical protein Scani_34700 [Streptomyces caniferus]|uniref:Uncharacterized protein n=1 Tax=Streptomyces caniferus TaxID=285557 RepID=A0A640S9K2_9ACTN|nr:hypothetical protein Scani_34700 [Streptomyces caniferus]
MTAMFGPAGHGKSQALKAALKDQAAAARRDGRRIWAVDPTGTWGHLLRKGPQS